jgi:hypothetical protein
MLKRSASTASLATSRRRGAGTKKAKVFGSEETPRRLEVLASREQ